MRMCKHLAVIVPLLHRWHIHVQVHKVRCSQPIVQNNSPNVTFGQAVSFVRTNGGHLIPLSGVDLQACQIPWLTGSQNAGLSYLSDQEQNKQKSHCIVQ